jgi:SAM-dependent methyltransferase
MAGRPRAIQVNLEAGLPFADASFRAVLAKDVIEHLHDPRLLLREAHRVTRNHAKLILVTPRAVPRAVWSDYTHIRGFTKTALRALLEDTGWRPLRLYRMGSVPLAGRLNIIHLLPHLLSIPGFGHFFGTNWQVEAVRLSV